MCVYVCMSRAWCALRCVCFLLPPSATLVCFRVDGLSAWYSDDEGNVNMGVRAFAGPAGANWEFGI